MVMSFRKYIFGIVLAATIAPLFSFAQALPDPAPFIIQEYEGRMWRYNLSADGTEYAPDKPVGDRGNLTEPILNIPLPPRQTLPPNIPRIPLQTPVPLNPGFVKPATCIYNGILNRSYTCSYMDGNGKLQTTTIYEFGDPSHFPRRSLPDPDFVAINALNTNNALSIQVPIDTATGRPASGVPMAYPAILKAQIDANKVLLGDYTTPFPRDLGYMYYNGPNGVTFFLLPGLINANATTLRATPRLYLPAVVTGGVRPCRPFVSNPGFPSITQIMQGNVGPAQLPVQPLPNTGGLGEPPGGDGTITSGGGVVGSFTDWWAQNGVLGNVQWSLYFEIPIVKWGGGQAAVPPPGMTPDGKAYNVYFALNGIPFAISFTDLNNDGVYESHILQLGGDPKNPNLAGIVREFKTYEEFTQFVDQLRRTPRPPLAPAK